MDTTAHTLAFAIYALAKNPGIQLRAQQEVDVFLQHHDIDKKATLPPYIEAVLKESMRKYPTADTGSMRGVTDPHGCTLSPDIHLEKGWWVSINWYCLQNSKAIWGENVDEFIPERWLNASHSSVG